MAEKGGETAPLLGDSPSPTHTNSSPSSPSNTAALVLPSPSPNFTQSQSLPSFLNDRIPPLPSSPSYAVHAAPVSPSVNSKSSSTASSNCQNQKDSSCRELNNEYSTCNETVPNNTFKCDSISIHSTDSDCVLLPKKGSLPINSEQVIQDGNELSQNRSSIDAVVDISFFGQCSGTSLIEEFDINCFPGGNDIKVSNHSNNIIEDKNLAPPEVQHNKVTFSIESDEGDDSFDERGLCTDIHPAPLDDKFCYPFITNNKASFLSRTSSTASLPFCRICHLNEGDESLISPCRCAGSLKFIHHACLMKWLEVSATTPKQSPTCELCSYEYQRTTKFRVGQCPQLNRTDRVLHITFLCCTFLMAVCAIVTIACFRREQEIGRRERKSSSELTFSEILTLCCGVVFFLAFFVALYAEVKAKDSLYRVCVRFYRLNRSIHIEDYDSRRDYAYAKHRAPV